MSTETQAVGVDVLGTSLSGFVTAAGVANFLGIPFARCDRRFCAAEKVPLTSLGTSVDATKWGPRCPQSVNHGRDRRGHLYEGHTAPAEMREAEAECLNLNVFQPQGAVGSETKLPVMVWIHGGGWVFGDGGPDYDGNSLVAEATRLGKPFIFVTVNYRLGYYGFLSSRELEAEAAAEGRPHVPNIGLHDQRLALEWVQENISHFGGSSAKVTVAGQSAGAWSALAHLVAGVQLCQRAIIMSPTVIEFETTAERQSTFDDLVNRAGVAVSSSESQKIQALRSVSDSQLTAWLNGAVLLRPTWDPAWFANLEPTSRLDQITSLPEWVENLMIGSAKDETAAIEPVWRGRSSDTIRRIVASIVPDPSLAEEIMHTYGIDSSEHERVVRGVVEMTTESFFGLFPAVLGERLTAASVYRFDQPDTFQESSCHGQAYHCLDLPFLIRAPAVAGTSAGSSLAATSDALSSAIASFVNGGLSWEAYNVSQTLMHFNGEISGLKCNTSTGRWKRFFDTPARAEVFVDTGRALMTYRPE